MPNMRHCNSILIKCRARELIKDWLLEVPELIHAEVVDFFFRRVMLLPGYANFK